MSRCCRNLGRQRTISHIRGHHPSPLRLDVPVDLGFRQFRRYPQLWWGWTYSVSLLRNVLPQITQLVRCGEKFPSLCSSQYFMRHFFMRMGYLFHHFKATLIWDVISDFCCRVLLHGWSACSFSGTSVKWLIMAAKNLGHYIPECALYEYLSCKMFFEKKKKVLWSNAFGSHCISWLFLENSNTHQCITGSEETHSQRKQASSLA